MSLLDFVIMGDLESVKYSLANGEDPNQQNEKGYTPLMIACCHGYLEITLELLVHGADVSIQDEDGWNALMCCSRYGHVEVVRSVLEKCSEEDINATNKKMMTALTLAASEDKYEVVELLVERSYRDNRSHALLFAAGKNYPRVVDILLKHNLSLSYSRDGYTAIDLARNMNNMDIFVNLMMARSRLGGSISSV